MAQVNVFLDDAIIAKVDRLRAGTDARPETSRPKFLSWVIERSVGEMAEPRKVSHNPRLSTAKHDRAFARMPDPIRGVLDPVGAPHEGARLKAARVAAGLSQPALGALCGGLSRPAVQRAEASASLDVWLALRAWLERQEGARVAPEGEAVAVSRSCEEIDASPLTV